MVEERTSPGNSYSIKIVVALPYLASRRNGRILANDCFATRANGNFLVAAQPSMVVIIVSFDKEGDIVHRLV